MTGTSPAVVLALSLFSFGLMAVIAVATAALIALVVAARSAAERRRAPVETARPPEPADTTRDTDAIDPAVVAAISAAVQATIGAHHIVWIGATAPSGGWTSEVRQKHHGSHRPHHDH